MFLLSFAENTTFEVPDVPQIRQWFGVESNKSAENDTAIISDENSTCDEKKLLHFGKMRML